MYVVGESNRGNKEAIDALEGAFGSQEFTASEAVAVIQGALVISELEASRLVRRLIELDAIKEA